MWLYDRFVEALEPQKVEPLDLTQARNSLRIDTVERHNLPYPDPEEPDFYSRRFAPRGNPFPAVHAAINILATTLARLPKTVARLEDPIEDQWDPLPNHPVSELLQYPSRQFDPWLFWEWILREMFTRGNGYAEITRYKSFPVELIPAKVTNSWVNGKIFRHAQRVIGDQRMRLMKNHWLVTLHGPGFTGIESPSPVWNYARQVISTQQAAMLYNWRSLAEGLSTRTAIELDALIGLRTGNQGKQLQARLQKAFSGARKAGGTPVLPPGAKLKSTQGMLSSVDVALIDLLKWGVEDIARVFNVAPRLLQHYHEGFRASKDVEAQFEDFERVSIQPHVHRLQEQLGNKLLTREDRSARRVIRFSTDRLKMGSFSEAARAVKEAVSEAGVLTINEGRRKLRQRPRPDGDRLIQPRGGPSQNGEKPQNVSSS